MKNYVLIRLKDGKEIRGVSLRINKKESLMIIKDMDNLVTVYPNNSGYEPTKKIVGIKEERTYIPLDHILYWQKIRQEDIDETKTSI